jgi:hypothetical protein
VNTKRAKRGYRDCGSDTAITAAARQALRAGMQEQREQRTAPQQQKTLIDATLDLLIDQIDTIGETDATLAKTALPSAKTPQEAINAIKELKRRCGFMPGLAARVKGIIEEARAANRTLVETAYRLSTNIEGALIPLTVAVQVQQAASVPPPAATVVIPTAPAVQEEGVPVSVAAVVPAGPPKRPLPIPYLKEPVNPYAGASMRPLPIPLSKKQQPVNPSAPPKPQEQQLAELKPTTGTMTLRSGKVVIEIKPYPNAYKGYYEAIYRDGQGKYKAPISIMIDQACPVNPIEQNPLVVAYDNVSNAIFFGCEMNGDKKENCGKVVVTREKLGNGYNDRNLQKTTELWMERLQKYILIEQDTTLSDSDVALKISAAWTCGGNMKDTRSYTEGTTKVEGDNAVYGYTSGHLKCVYEKDYYIANISVTVKKPQYASFENAVRLMQFYKAEFAELSYLKNYIVSAISTLVQDITNTGSAPEHFHPSMVIAALFENAEMEKEHRIILALNPFVQSYQNLQVIGTRGGRNIYSNGWYDSTPFETVINQILAEKKKTDA